MGKMIEIEQADATNWKLSKKDFDKIAIKTFNKRVKREEEATEKEKHFMCVMSDLSSRIKTALANGTYQD